MCAPFDEGLFLASSIPGARLVPLETRSHVPMLGEPSFYRVIEEIEGFVTTTPAGVAPAFPDLTRRGASDPRAHRARARQLADRRAPRPLGEDGAQSHHRRLRQDGRREPRAGHRAGPRSRPRRRAAPVVGKSRDTGPGFRAARSSLSAHPGPRPHGPRARAPVFMGVTTARDHRSRQTPRKEPPCTPSPFTRSPIPRSSGAPPRRSRCPRPLKLHTVFPSTDGAKAVCLWEGEGLPAIKQFVEQITSGVATNEYMPVEASERHGPAEVRGRHERHRRSGRGQDAPAVRVVFGGLRRRRHDAPARGRGPVRGPRLARRRARCSTSPPATATRRWRRPGGGAR